MNVLESDWTDLQEQIFGSVPQWCFVTEALKMDVFTMRNNKLGGEVQAGVNEGAQLKPKSKHEPVRNSDKDPGS